MRAAEPETKMTASNVKLMTHRLKKLVLQSLTSFLRGTEQHSIPYNRLVQKKTVRQKFPLHVELYKILA